ncbi:MAG: Holliday junction branch migration protein RuvA [bacterium]
MIAHIEGTISEKAPTRIVVDVNGVGYELLVPITTFDQLEEIGAHTKLLTYLHVRQDFLQLFGFSSSEEKAMFLNLITVSGVGPKLALGILSGCPVTQLRRFIAQSDVQALTRLPGLGKKTAERLVTELRDKFGKMDLETATPKHLPQSTIDAQTFEEGVLALAALGYPKALAQSQVLAILNKEPDLTLDELIKRVLQSK